MKVNKAGFWVAFSLALASIIAGVIIMLIPCPIVAEGSITATYSSHTIYFHGKLTNESDKAVRVSKLVIVVETTGDSIEASDKEGFTLAAGETLDLGENGFAVPSNYNARKVTRVSVTVNGLSHDVYGGSSVSIWSIMLFVLGAAFAIATIATLITNGKKKKSYEAFKQSVPNLDGAATFSGFYSKKGETGKAVGKTALSAVGGALSAAFLGVGFYKIYGAGTAVELVVNDDGLYVLNPANGGTSFFEKGHFPASDISVKKNNVTLTNVATQEYFVFKTTKKSMTTEQLVEKLKELTAALPEQTETVNAEAPAPFAELSGESAKVEPAKVEAAPAATDEPEEK